MSDLVSKQKLTEWLDVEIDLSSGNSALEKEDRWAFRHIKREVESGRLNADDSEVQRLREALKEIEKELRSDHDGHGVDRALDVIWSLSPQKGEPPK